jgi:hypothetical protein
MDARPGYSFTSKGYTCSKVKNVADDLIGFSYHRKYDGDKHIKKYITALSNKFEFYSELQSEFDERVKRRLKSKYVSTMTELLKWVE